MHRKKFKTENEKIGRDWRNQVVGQLNWIQSENQVGAKGGEAGGYFVQADGFGRRGYLKPANPHPNAAVTARAAREKIASDLAHELRLPVPPAVLARRNEPPQGCEATVVVTLVMYPAQYHWEQVRGYTVDNDPRGLALASLYSGCSEMYVFNTWVNQTDHGDHPNNIVLGYDPVNMADSQLIFLDYAYSLGHDNAWTQDHWSQVDVTPINSPG